MQVEYIMSLLSGSVERPLTDVEASACILTDHDLDLESYASEAHPTSHQFFGLLHVNR